MKRIPIIQPKISGKVFTYLKDVFKSGILTRGKYVSLFENKIKSVTQSKYGFAVTSGTTALHLALAAIGIKEGDEVLVADFTFPATANVVVQLGAKPVLVDINLETLCMDVSDLEKKITQKSQAIMVVHAFGYPADMSRINKIAKAHNLKVIEDAACALGSKHKDKACGAWGELGCFSFHPRKVITTGEGGVVVTDNKDLAQKIDSLRNHGSIKTQKGLEFKEAGFNYRMSELQAALGVEQMAGFKKIEKKRLNLAKNYKNLLKNIPEITLFSEPKDGFFNYQAFIVLFDEKTNREKVMAALAEKNIETTIGTYALHTQPAFAKYGYKPKDLKNSYIAYKQTMALPLYFDLTKTQQKYIIKTLKEALKGAAHV